MAATIGAELLNPYEMAGLAAPTAIKLTELPKHQITPPSMPNKWVLGVALKKASILTGFPCTGFAINKGLRIKVHIKAPIEKNTTAVYDEIFPASASEKSVASEEATNL